MQEFELKTVGKQIAVSGISGACLGLVYAACTGKPRLTSCFYMATNWTIAAVPFFTIRQSIIWYRNPNDRRELDRSRMVASLASGTMLGIGAGYFWGGPWAILPAVIVHFILSGTGQSFVTKLDHWRIQKAIEYLNEKEIPEKQKRWNHEPFRMNATPHDPREETTFDPAKYLFDMIKSSFFGMFFDEPPSCFKYAADVEYRKKLNMKLLILTQQIEELQQELEKKGIDYRPPQ